MPYNGDANQFMKETIGNYEQNLTEIYQRSVQAAQEADRQIQSFMDEFAGTYTANLDAQQALDQDFADHMMGLEQQRDQMQSKTDALYEQMSGAVEHLNSYRAQANGYQPTCEESEIEMLERLYKM